MTQQLTIERTVKIDVEPGTPYLEQYLGAWAMHTPAFQAAIARINAMDIMGHIRAEEAKAQAGGSAGGGGYQMIEGGIAEIEIIGSLTKYQSSLSSNPGMVNLRKSVRQAARDGGVRAIVLKIDSPGGTVKGTDDLARDVQQAASVKPVTAYVDDMAASAAYYIASQAGELVVNASGVVGSIGVYGAIYDWSEHFEQAGVKVHIVKSAEFKGAGHEGTVITADQLAEFKREMMEWHELFVGAVAAGRGVSRETVAGWADGRVHIGEKAREKGLVDKVQSYEQTLAGVRQAIDSDPVRAMAAAAETEESRCQQMRRPPARRSVIRRRRPR